MGWSDSSSIEAGRGPGHSCTRVLPAKRTSDLQPATAPPPPTQGLLPLSWPPPAALQAPWSRKQPQLLLALKSSSSPRRSQGRCQEQVLLPSTAAMTPSPPARAEAAQLRGPDGPQRGDPLAPRTVPSPARGRPAGSTRGLHQPLASKSQINSCFCDTLWACCFLLLLLLPFAAPPHLSLAGTSLLGAQP